MNIRNAMIGGAALLLLAGGSAGWELVAGTDPEDELVATASPLPVPPTAPRLAEDGRTRRCLDLLADDPEGALAMAETPAGTTPSDREGAAQCRGLAEIALGDVDKGAAQLDALAAGSVGPAPARAAVFGQAAQAWLMAGDAERACASATSGLALAPQDPDLLTARAEAASLLDRFGSVIDDVTAALAIDPRRPEALVMRAAARRQLGQLGRAESDIDHALALDPDNAEALLERGILRQRHDDAAGARQDWERAIALAPDSATAELAEQNLALLLAGANGR